MMISKTSRYALQATAMLAEFWLEERAVAVGDLAETLGVPRNYLSKILHQLARQGVLSSERGPRGGFRLVKSPADTKLIEIVMTVEPAVGERQCLLGRPTCSDATPCSAHARWRLVSGEVLRFLEETSLADLVDPLDDPLDGV